MSTAEGPTAMSLPSGTSPAPEKINHQDQSGVITIITGFSLGLVILSACMKLYARKYFRNFQHDDMAFALTISVAITQASLVFYAIHFGLGVALPNLSAEQAVKIRKADFAEDLLYITTLYLSKICCSLFFLWLAPDPRRKNFAWALIAASTLWMVSSMFVEGFRCGVEDLWAVDSMQCTAFFARWIYIGIFDMVLEFTMFLTSFHLVWNRHIRLSSRLAIIGAFTCRLPNIALTALRLFYLHAPVNPPTSAYWTSQVACTTQIGLAWSIVSAMIPYLRPLVTAYERDGLTSKNPSEGVVETTPSRRLTRDLARERAERVEREEKLREEMEKEKALGLERGPSFHYPDGANTRTVGYEAGADKGGDGEGEGEGGSGRLSGGSSSLGGIEMAVRIEVDEEPVWGASGKGEIGVAIG